MSICELTLRDSILRALRLVHLTCWSLFCLEEWSSVDDDNSMRVPVAIKTCFGVKFESSCRRSFSAHIFYDHQLGEDVASISHTLFPDKDKSVVFTM
jgi:hypothetical protein